MAAMIAVSPAVGQVRVLNGDIEHFYGPGGELLDNRALQEKNARIEERARIQRERAEYERRMQAIQENYDRAMANIRQRQEDIQEGAERRARNNAWNLH